MAFVKVKVYAWNIFLNKKKDIFYTALKIILLEKQAFKNIYI